MVEKLARQFGGALSAAFAILFLSGCYLQSVKPFCSEQDVVEVKGLKGVWRPVKLFKELEEGKVNDWLIKSGEVICFDEDNIMGVMQLKCFKIDDKLFANITIGEDKSRKFNLFWWSCIRPTHSIVKIELARDVLKITPINYFEVEKRLKSRELKVSFIEEAGQVVLLADETETLKDMIKTLAADEKIFQEKDSFILKRVTTD